MADSVRAEVRGYAELLAGSETLFENIAHRAPVEFGQVADQVAAQVGVVVPRRTGALASSINAALTGDVTQLRMGDGIDYAPYVEYGGRGFPHTAVGNYLTPAALDAEPLLVEAATKVAEDEIGGMHWPSP